MVQQLNPEAIDVLFVNGWGFSSSLAAIRFGRKYRIPLVVMSDSTEWDHPRKQPQEWIKRNLLKLFSAAFVAGQPHQRYLQNLGFPESAIVQGYDVIDNSFFMEGSLTRGGTNESRTFKTPYFLASGRFIEKKNHLLLIQAYADFRKDAEERNGPIPDLVIIGEGSLRNQMEEHIHELNLSGSVHLPGFKQYEELPTVYADATAFLHPSTSEQWGLVVNEAMAAGLPVIVSSKCGCVEDLVEEGINGFKLDPDNKAAWTHTMSRIAKMSSPERERMGAASRERIKLWGVNRFCQGFQDAMQTARKNGHTRPGFVPIMLFNILSWLKRGTDQPGR
jgi:glycosyltransferase involved in cell wall biosynthesis